MSYEQMGKIFMQDKNPQEAERMEEAGTLEPFLTSLANQTAEREREIAEDVAKRLPEPKTELERMQRDWQAQSVARELAREEMLNVLMP